MADTLTTKTKTPPSSSKTKQKKSKIVTYRFSITPTMSEMLDRLEKRFVMLDRTEIVKLSISKLIETEQLNNDIGFEEALAWVTDIKDEWRK